MQGRINGNACALLALTTRLAWEPDMPQPLPRKIVWRLLNTGALCGLTLRDMPGIEEKWLERAYDLLRRLSDVYEGIEAYRKEGYRLLLPEDMQWPSSLHVLGDEQPLFLFTKGNEALVASPKLSVAGSRRILSETQRAAEKTGGMIAQERAVLVTGGANGVDCAALHGALCFGGSAVIIPAVPANQLLNGEKMCVAYDQGRLTILCDTLPDEPFSASKALNRNHTIYALGRASLVVAARSGRGGSWNGATACLRGQWSPVYVWDGENVDTQGNLALEKLGAQRYTLDLPLKAQLKPFRSQVSMFDSE